MSEVICVGHAPDFDGIGSMMLMVNRFDLKPFDPAGDNKRVVWPYNYRGYEFPWDLIGTETLVYMVDVSLPIDDMIRLDNLCRLVVLDHHETLIRDMEERGVTFEGIQEAGRAAIQLTWEWLYGPHEAVPQWVEYIGLWDVYDHSDPDTVYFQWGLRGVDSSLGAEVWADLLNEAFYEQPAPLQDGFESLREAVTSSIIERGIIVHDYVQQMNKQFEARAFEATFEGHTVLAVNGPVGGFQAVKEIFNPEKHAFVLTFTYGPLGSDIGVRVGLYGGDQTGVNCGEIARRFGGGGHAGAAGFTVNTFSEIGL
jgi:oligoribonuclease NrnB/cAMP/cGMP phosphodiesterase (DHH superfamily)